MRFIEQRDQLSFETVRPINHPMNTETTALEVFPFIIGRPTRSIGMQIFVHQCWSLMVFFAGGCTNMNLLWTDDFALSTVR